MPNHAPHFRRALLAWYRREGRDLPWRHTRDPYAILVSEIMLQQTQVATVLSYYREWLRRFPDFQTLARSDESDVLHAWQGLGYYTRGRNLHAAAKIVVARLDGLFPRDIGEMRELPGIGRYTAHAVATFSFDRPVAVVEANIARVLARISNLQLPIDSAPGLDFVWNLATALVSPRRAHDYNSALMDLGALICTPRRPKCDRCPVRSFCQATDPDSLPRKKARPAIKTLVERHFFAVRRNLVLLEQSAERWRGLWILPRISQSPNAARPIYRAEFPFTNHRITLEVYRQPPGRVAATPGRRWFPLDSLGKLALPSPHRRALTALATLSPRKLGSTLAPT
ncbi:MAG: A/G-specific adenine glycosylase [Chthoniobacterales bacterium]